MTHMIWLLRLIFRLKEEMFALTQQIYHIGLERYQEREQEVKEFQICLNNAKRRNQIIGQEYVCNKLTVIILYKYSL